MHHASASRPAPPVQRQRRSRHRLSAVCSQCWLQFAVAALDHGHIYGQTNGLLEAGGELRWVYDPDPKKVEAFCETYPQAKPVDSLEKILEDDAIKMVSAAAIPSDRGPLGIRVMVNARGARHELSLAQPCSAQS